MNTTHKIIAWLVGAILLVALGVTVSFWTFWQIEEDAAVRKHTFAVLGGAQELQSELKDAESDQRGYLLTGEESYLITFSALHNRIPGDLKKLRQITLVSAAQQRLDALASLVDANLAQMKQAIELHRNHNIAAAQALERSTHGRHLMDEIRLEMSSFTQIEQDVLTLREAEFEASMRHLFSIIFATSLFTLLFAVAFAWLIYRETQQRLKNLVHLKTKHLLVIQEETNKKLLEANATLQIGEERLEDKNVELERAKLVAEKANLAKSIFLSRMSHELRTPLNAILGFAQLLEAASPPLTAVQIPRLNQITKAGWYLLELINEILDLAVIESGKLSLSREPVSLSEVMRECQAMIESQAQQHDIKLIFPQFDTPFFVSADRIRVKQVLINLLSNAIKYNREHGIVEVKCTLSTPERIHISIKNSGAGLPSEMLDQLFQPFNRLGQENGTEEGTGIGLVVAKQLVELMGGAIGVESTVGVGSEFWIELIRDVSSLLGAEATRPVKLAPQAKGHTHEDVVRSTLLYVEDNPANLMLVEQIIEGRPDVHMLSARDGSLGVALARTHFPDVILMDLNLPGISGFEAMTILRNDPTTAHIPVVALSANAMLHDIEIGLEAGFFRYLTKPIRINEFMIAFEDALKFSKMKLVEK